MEKCKGNSKEPITKNRRKQKEIINDSLLPIFFLERPVRIAVIFFFVKKEKQNVFCFFVFKFYDVTPCIPRNKQKRNGVDCTQFSRSHGQYWASASFFFVENFAISHNPIYQMYLFMFFFYV